MKKFLFISALLMCILQQVVSQSTITIAENFDGNTVSFTASPASAWGKDTNYYSSPPNAYLGRVPNMTGMLTMLESPVYDFYAGNYNHVLLRFKHICKISPLDTIRIEYKIRGYAWRPVPATTYLGNAANYNARGFCAASYPEWQAGDSLALPQASWWKEEAFDVSIEVALDDEAQFRFVIKHGNTGGTQISYGWLLDNIEIIASQNEVKPPIVEFVAPFVRDSVYDGTGPYSIRAKVKSQSSYMIQTPWLIYTAMVNGVSLTDSTLMTAITGDSIWECTIPQFVFGTKITYSVTGKDAIGNVTTTSSDYTIARPSHIYGNHSVALTAINSPVLGQVLGGISTPITVRLGNKGDSILTSATINWSLNGVVQISYPWTGNLPWDFEIQTAFGNYTPRIEGYDTLIIWVSMPNGVADIVTNDDSLAIITYGCYAAMSGMYSVGSSGTFPSVPDALAALALCAPVGNITLALEEATYNERWNFSNLSTIMGNHTLTITSLANHSDSVILRPASGVGITLANTRNLILKAITIDAATSGTYAVQFATACTNVVIRDCQLLANQTGTTAATGYAPVYKTTNTGIVDSIFFINNILNGGFYGIYFYGGTSSAYGTHIVFDSNTVSNQYSTGVYSYYTDFISCSYNSILSRQINPMATAWIGFFINSINGPIVGNRIRQRSTTITSPTGMQLQYYNYYFPNPNPNKGLIANNEIILNTTGTYLGIYANDYIRANILHNSIYITGTGGSRGIQITNSANNDMEIKNNYIILATTSNSSHPIYFSVTGNLTSYDMAYNNLYAQTYVGYYGGNINMTTWIQTFTTDLHSVRISPSFVNTATNLELSDYTNLHCPFTSKANSDIQGAFRGGETTMGAYHGLIPQNGDAVLTDLTALGTKFVFGQTDTISVVVYNAGTTPLTFVNLEWSVNGISQAVGGTNYPVSLNYGESATITLGQLTYPAGSVSVLVWLNNLNNTTLQDDYLANDTLQASTYVCAGAFNGTYTIGTTGDFPSWSVALERAAFCGIGGDVVFAFQPDTYTHVLDFTNNASLFANNKLSITSTTGNATDVIFRPASGAGVILNNTRNLILEAITIDVSTLATAAPAVQFTAACTNIVIRGCRLLASPTTTTSSVLNAPIVKTSGTGAVDSLFIINNLLDGGYYGFYFYAGTSNTVYGTHLVFDSNTVSNQYYCGVYTLYTDFTSCSYDSILSRQSGTMGPAWTWFGFNIQYCNGSLVSNRIIQRCTVITQPTGMQLQYYNYYFPNPNPNKGLIANNEIILNTNGLYSGINANTYTRAKIFHNSIYISGTGAARGILITNSVYSDLEIKNNNVVLASAALSCPIYFPNVNAYGLVDIDYNNYYAPTYVGYYGTYLSMATWTPQFPTDRHSVQILPNFVDSSTSLELTDYTDLYCYRLPDVLANIHGDARPVYTTMGAHGIGITDVYDMALSAITSPINSGELCSPDYAPVRFELQNTGIIDHDFSTNPVTLHFSVAAAPNIAAFDTLLLIDTGNLKRQQKQVFELMNSLDVSRLGAYAITGWITNAKDSMPENDTLRSIYQNLQIGLPIDEDFSGGIPAAFSVRADNTSAIWQQITQGTGTDTAVRPVFGTGMLAFSGSRGAMSTLSSIQLDLSQTIQPALSFWYFHDTIPSIDYTEVRITVDGGATYNALFSLTKYDAVYGWQQYSVNLPSYAISRCVILVIEAMELSNGNTTQYIDRIRITARKDLEVSEIIIPELTACDMDNKEVKVVVHAVTNQAINLSGSQLAVEIAGHTPIIVAFPHAQLEGYGYDTITLPHRIDLDMGNYVIKAYVTSPVDDAPINDTAKYRVDIRPSLAVRLIDTSSQTSPVDAGVPIKQKLTINNTGNVDLSNLRLRLLVLVNGQTDTILEETLTGITIAAGDSLSYTLSSTYFVPWASIYGVLVEVMGCDPAKIHASMSINEFANTDDLGLRRIDNPSGSLPDTIGKAVYVKITLKNRSQVNDFQNVKATVIVWHSNGVVSGMPYSEAIPFKIPLSSDTTTFTFSQAYTVPNDTAYSVTVFIENVLGGSLDHFRTNDTATVTRKTVTSTDGITETGNSRISLNQNTPNPATGTTRIDYSLPTDGEVSFHVYTISGQELFNQVVETTSGKHSIDLNTTHLASGIYFYSMEFNGQRIVKRMSVNH